MEEPLVLEEVLRVSRLLHQCSLTTQLPYGVVPYIMPVTVIFTNLEEVV